VFRQLPADEHEITFIGNESRSYTASPLRQIAARDKYVKVLVASRTSPLCDHPHT
jgi:hypothetical protein